MSSDSPASRRLPPIAPNDPAVEAAFRAAPADVLAQILDGELVLHPRPSAEHADVAIGLSDELSPPFRRGRGGPGGWVLLPEPEVHLGLRPEKLVPDLAGWRRERMPERPSAPAITLVPDWVCEILSAGSEADDRGRKMRIYRREGVRHYWLADPRVQTLEIYRLNERGRWEELETFEGDGLVRAPPFDAIELNLRTLWAR